ncbi:MAG: Histidine kinase [Ignavibacteria bacterium]|nr:MAG: Histidine kinase [Ignavibacteria bacterium]KAF0157957.1 MAG: Histidine kinase [Ignavibacteria bacterium]
MPPTQNKTFEQTRTEISFKEILEFAPIGILIFQRNWKIKFVNSNFFAFPGVLGEKPENTIGQSVYDNRLFDKIDIRPELELIQKGENIEKQISVSKSFRGVQISLLLKGSPITLEDENAGGILIIEDIKIDTSKTQTGFSKSTEFKNFLKYLGDYYAITDTEGLIKESAEDNNSVYNFLLEADSIKQNKKLSPILFKKNLEIVVSSNETLTTRIPFIRDGLEFHSKINLIPFSEDGLTVDTVVLILEDLSKQTDGLGITKTEIEELSKYQQITASVVDGLIGVNKNGRIIFWNESSAKLFGLTKSEVFGKMIGKIFPSLDEAGFEKLKTDVGINNFWNGILTIGFDETTAEHFKVKFTELKDEAEESYIFLCTNITESIRTEKELRDSEEKFRNIVANSPDFICTLDRRGNITYGNKHFLEVFSLSNTELRKTNFRDLIDPDFLLSSGFDFDDVAGQSISSVDLPLINKLGHRVFVLANISTTRNTKSELQSFTLNLSDITSKKEAEKDLLLIRSVFEASVDGIALINKNRFVLVNDSFVKMFSYSTTSEMIDEIPLNLVSEKDKELVSAFLEISSEKSAKLNKFSFTAKRKDGTTFAAENSVSFYEVEGERFMVWVLRDETEEAHAKEALLASEERYRSITDSINECIWAAENVKGELKAIFYTPSIKKITSYEPQDFLNDAELWGKIIHPDDVDYVGDKMDNLYGDPIRNLETLEYRIIDKLGSITWIENKITVVRDQKGKIQKVFGIISDISLAKRVDEELKRYASDLKELNETKDRFISIVSHDLRTPFSSIIGFTDLLLNEKNIDEEKRMQYIRFIQESSKSMLGLVNSLLDWTRLQTGRIRFEPDRVNAKYVIDKSIQILSGAAIQKKIKIVNELAKELYIHADEELLLQVFNNLVSNAVKFTKPEGSIVISAKANVEKKQVEFSVKDDGIGIKESDIFKIFKIDTKFTTSGTAGEKGSGLGLSLVHDIIRKHGGDIWVNSEVGKGTQFIFSIPVASSYLLIVDDMKTDRLLYTKLIKSLVPNYNILEAENGKAALDIIKQSLPALVITDHNMPVMNGYDFVKQLSITPLKYKPPIIVLSGDVNKTIEAEYKEFGVEYIFSKPVNLSAFKNAIERSLRKAIFN